MNSEHELGFVTVKVLLIFSASLETRPKFESDMDLFMGKLRVTWTREILSENMTPEWMAALQMELLSL